jgi:hypothetical protein
MRIDRGLFRRLTWLALFGLVFGSFAPAVSGALAAGEPVPAAVICGAGGSRVVVPASGTKRAPAPGPADGARCGYCLLAYYWPALPLATASWMTPGVAGVAASGGRFDRDFAKPVYRYAHRSRAPPRLAPIAV